MKGKVRIVLTGGLGFIGANLVKWLDADHYEVTIVDNITVVDSMDYTVRTNRLAKIVKERPDVKIIKDDIFNFQIPEGTDCVIHLAALAGVRRSFREKDEYVRNNFDGTDYMISQIAKMHHRPLFINASSSSVYGNSKKEKSTENDDINKTISPYAMTKSCAESLIKEFTKAHGISAISLRFFTVYGPGMRPDLAICKFTRAIDNENEIELYGDGTTSRDYTYIDDICMGTIKALKWGMQRVKDNDTSFYEVFNLCSGNSISLDDMVNEISEALGKNALVRYVDKVNGDVDKTLGSYQKAHEILDYTPAFTFDKGIRCFCDWYKEEGRKFYGLE